MKFSHSLQINSRNEWSKYYIAYSHLKKIIYLVEKAALGLAEMPRDFSNVDMEASFRSRAADEEAGETRALLNHTDSHTQSTVYPRVGADECNAFFYLALDDELDRIVAFYERKDLELRNELASLVNEVRETEVSHGESMDLSDQGNSSSECLIKVDFPSPQYFATLLWSSEKFKSKQKEVSQRIVDLYVDFCEFVDYVDLNETGFAKVCKKYDKVIGTEIKVDYMNAVEQRLPFLNTTKTDLSHEIAKIVTIYSRIETDGKIGTAQSALKAHLRDHVVFERNSIWRDMVDKKRLAQTTGFIPSKSRSEKMVKYRKMTVLGGTLYLPTSIPFNFISFVLACFLLLTMVHYPLFETPEQSNCFAILIFASVLWAFEVLPLFVTSLLVPFLVVLLRVMRSSDGVRLAAKDTAKLIFSDMFGPVIMLLLGGFSLAAALSKHNIAKEAASFILSRAGTKPHWVLLANMFVSTFASMWISNVAAPVLVFSLISPILRNLPSKSKYARCLVMGIAMAANVGGMVN